MEKEPNPRSRGRPRTFDREAALQKALHLFWERGYEGTSITELVTAMGVVPPSLYAAFGSKEALYREAVQLYLKGPGRFVARALEEEPTAERAVARILREAARGFRTNSHPCGCMVSTGALACAPEHREVAEALADVRRETLDAIARRLEQAQTDGELSPGVDARNLARFYASVIQGMSIQARDGASRAELAAIAETALQSWPKRTGRQRQRSGKQVAK